LQGKGIRERYINFIRSDLEIGQQIVIRKKSSQARAHVTFTESSGLGAIDTVKI